MGLYPHAHITPAQQLHQHNTVILIENTLNGGHHTQIKTPGRTLENSALDELAAKVRGTLIAPEHPEYNRARQVFNAMIDRHPQLMVRCVDVAAVVAAVNFARDHELPLAVRRRYTHFARVL